MQEWIYGFNNASELTFIPIDRVSSMTWLKEEEDCESGMLIEFKDDKDRSVYLRKFSITRNFNSTFETLKSSHDEIVKTLR